MPGSVIVAGARTPIGKFRGVLASLSCAELGALAIRGAVGQAGMPADSVDRVVLGQVIAAGTGQMPSKQAAVAAGIPMKAPALTINMACLSGLQAIAQADQLITLGLADVVVAGGMESMTNAPHLMLQGRVGYRAGDVQLRDALFHDGLDCGLEHCSMGLSTENTLVRFPNITRDHQDALAVASHERAAEATRSGRFSEEIVPVDLPTKRNGHITVQHDEGVRPGTTVEGLSSLHPAFVADGSVTAGNSSQISDGAAAVVVMSRPKADTLGIRPLAEIVSYGTVAGPDTSLLLQPAAAATVALERAGLATHELDLVEINEAFAAVVIASVGSLKIPMEIVNVNGGAIALGHPVGMSGTRLALTMAHELRRRSAEYGLVSLCGGGGQGDAMVLRRVS